MKRVLLSTFGTVAGLIALLTFKSQGHPLTTTGALPSAGLPGSGSSSTPTTAPPAGGDTSGGSSSAPPPAARSSSAKAASRTVAGDAVETRYGVVQVQVTVSGNRIDNVSFLQLTAFDGRSQEINGAAAPILLQETLSAQSAHIDNVSGASYTTDGYLQSLQSALDKAGIR
jgi:uncharacterized protein with FMN-binding domain